MLQQGLAKKKTIPCPCKLLQQGMVIFLLLGRTQNRTLHKEAEVSAPASIPP